MLIFGKLIGYSRVGQIKKVILTLLNGMKVKELLKEVIMDLENERLKLCNLIPPKTVFLLLVMSLWLNFGIWIMLIY